MYFLWVLCAVVIVFITCFVCYDFDLPCLQKSSKRPHSSNMSIEKTKQYKRFPNSFVPENKKHMDLKFNTLLYDKIQGKHYEYEVLDRTAGPYSDLVLLSKNRPNVRKIWWGIGINYISMPENELPSCWNDIYGLKNLLDNNYGYSNATCFLTTDDPHPNMKATPPMLKSFTKIQNEIIRLANENEKEGFMTEIMLHYSGHGYFQHTWDPSELDGQKECWVLLDSFVWDSELSFNFIHKLPKTVNMWIVSDSCNSGSVANLPWKYNILSNTLNQDSLETSILANVVSLSGCRDEQTSNAGQDTSTLTGALIDLLAQNMTITTLLIQLHKKLRYANETQIPELSMSNSICFDMMVSD